MFCLVYQWIISQAADGQRTIAPAVQKHIDRCAACRTFYEATASLKWLLPAQNPPPPQTNPRRKAKVLSALSAGASVPPPRRRLLRAVAAAASLAVIITAAVWLSLGDGPKDRQPHQSESVAPAQLADFDPLLTKTMNPEQFNHTWQSLLDESMIREMHNLEHETKSAVTFLLASLMIELEENPTAQHIP